MPGFLYVLGTDGALWHEANNYHTTGQRTLVDTNVKAFDPDPSTPGFLYVLGTDGALWHEANNYHTTGQRTLVDTSVQAFDPDPSTPGFLYVLGTDGGLWHEANNYHTTGQRTLVDTSVQAFAPDPTTSGFLYVLGTDGGLWHEANNYHTTGQRTLVDTSVKAFAPDPTTSGFLYVLETDGDLWFEFNNYQTTKQHSLVDTSVQAFAPDPTAPSSWFTQNPAAATAYSPAPAGTLLFNTGVPSYPDVEQGAVGDCWLLASLAEVAARDPNDIESMFTKDGSSTVDGSEVGYYTVRFFNNNGSPVYVQVDTQFPSAGQEYDQVVNVLGTKALWVALAEKAYAEAGYLGYVNIPIPTWTPTTPGRPGRRRRSSVMGAPRYHRQARQRLQRQSHEHRQSLELRRAHRAQLRLQAQKLRHCGRTRLRRRRLQPVAWRAFRGFQSLGRRLFSAPRQLLLDGPREHRVWPVLRYRGLLVAELHRSDRRQRGD